MFFGNQNLALLTTTLALDLSPKRHAPPCIIKITWASLTFLGIDVEALRRIIAILHICNHFYIKAFYGTTENAVKTQLWIAISIYILIAIMKNRLNLSHSLYEIRRVLDLSMFEIVPIPTLLGEVRTKVQLESFPVQQEMFQTLGH